MSTAGPHGGRAALVRVRPSGLEPRSRAGLLSVSACVGVGPPLFCNVPSPG
jgi:hypothetical protein